MRRENHDYGFWIERRGLRYTVRQGHRFVGAAWTLKGARAIVREAGGMA